MEMHHPFYQPCFRRVENGVAGKGWKRKGRVAQLLFTSSRTHNFVCVHTEHLRKPVFSACDGTSGLSLRSQQRTQARICMSGRQYAARSQLIFSDTRSWDSGSLLLDHSVWNEDEKPQAFLRPTASSATSIKGGYAHMRVNRERSRLLENPLCTARH